MPLRPVLVSCLLLLSFISFSQPYTISGRIVDVKDTSALIGVTVIVVNADDSTIKTGGVTDADGNFEIPNINAGKYRVRMEYVGYMSVAKQVTVTDNNVALGTMSMGTSVNQLKGVTVGAKQIRAEQIGDTSQYRADAFKTNPDASAEDLVNKMPGISSDNTGVKVNGETVQQVYVDGKPFFGTDPSLALKNLPAEVIDKIQVFDKLSDQSNFTGFDDGSTQKTLNIITKKNKSTGTFGKVYAGYGTDDRYIAGGNLNIFKGDRRISLLGMSNNINQQNFSSEDILGALGSSSGQNRGGGRSGRGSFGGGGNNFMVGQQGGITTTNSLGFNYSDNWGKKIKVSGSYFFNGSDNVTATDITRNYFTQADSSNVYHEYDDAKVSNFNHRANLRMEYTIDSSNSIIFTPGVSFQKNNTVSNAVADNSIAGLLTSTTNNRSTSDNTGYSSNNNLLYQHKFGKPRRTISLNLSNSINEKTGEGSYLSANHFYTPSDSIYSLNQQSDLYNKGNTLSGNVTYTEPVGKKGQIMANYNPSYSNSSADKETFNQNVATQQYTDLDPRFSNKYENTYITQKGGLSYRIGDRKLNFNFGANVQYATLHGEQVYPNNFTLDRNFTSVLPTAMFNYKYADGRNLRVMYRTNTQAPSVNQLQNVVDISNPLLLKSGNAGLRQNYEQTFIVRYGLTKAKTARNFFLNLYGNYVTDYIGNATYIATSAPINFTDPFTNTSILINRGSQLTRPVNLDGYLATRSFLTYGMPVQFIKSNLNLNGGFNFSRIPGLVNDVVNYANNYIPSAGMVLSSNINENLDFTLAYSGNYNIVKNTVQAQANNNYYNHTASFRINYIFLKHFVLNSNITDNYYTAFSSTGDQNFILWNAYLGYKMLKNNALEARISVYDLLNQNKSISRTVTETYIENSNTQVLRQYFMLQLTYTIRNFKGTAPAQVVPVDDDRGPRMPRGDMPPRQFDRHR